MKDVNELITIAQALCDLHRVKLTKSRIQILHLLATHQGLIKAYDLLTHLQKIKSNATPMEIYRGLDFLEDIGLLHKVSALNGFIMCSHPHQHTHFCLMLVCETCGSVRELQHEVDLFPLYQLAQNFTFTPAAKPVVITGRCQLC